jgi:valyl-tRNA synthetase
MPSLTVSIIPQLLLTYMILQPSIESLKHAAEKWSFTVEAVKRRWTRLEKSIPKLEKKYGGPKFTEKVPKENVAQENVAKKSPKQKEVSK